MKISLTPKEKKTILLVGAIIVFVLSFIAVRYFIHLIVLAGALFVLYLIQRKD